MQDNASMHIRSLEHDNRIFTYSDRPMHIPRAVTDRLLDMISQWARVYPFEDTHVFRSYGIPSIVVRFDGVLRDDGSFGAYEIQSGCGWVGYARLANTEFRKIHDDLKTNAWPSFKLVAPNNPTNPDEKWWLEQISIDEAVRGSDLLWVRHYLEDFPIETHASIVARSVKPMRTHNNKIYGVHMGWWTPILWHESDHGRKLPWDKPFVLKPTGGHGSADIMLWMPDSRAGRSTRTQIVRTLQRLGKMYLQHYIPPMEVDIEGAAYNAVLRPFFGYDPRSRRWTPMHGVWTARPAPNIRLHGASDAITGPLFLED